MTAPRDAATERQVQAADPRVSTWLSANAGSGKTRVLTDRVARLLLEGVDPAHILCLTYTKAAASEMQNRLFRRLGAWAMMPRDRLTAELQGLGVEGRIDAERIAEARRLFARAIETPGGLRIQTIHSFCAGLLRRFPREAGLSPSFTEMEDRAAQLLRAEVMDEIALGPDAAVIEDLARHLTTDDFDRFLADIAARREAFARMPTQAELAAMFGLSPDARREDALSIAVEGHEAAIVADLRAAFANQSRTYQDFAARLSAVPLDPLDWAGLETLFGLFLYQGGKSAGQSKSTNFPQSHHRKAVEAMEPVAEAVHDWMDRAAAAREHLLACDALDRTRALYRFATRFVPAYEAAKQARGLVDFDDLIHRTRALLTDPAVAQWVLFRLDGGIDHILVDEAQDTSPAQWAVIESLAQEFATGEGAHPDRRRTIFVVGDKKQSIYSFQGADPEGFDRMQALFGQRLGAAGIGLNSLTLDHSFRSAEAILRVVDRTFVDPWRDGLGEPQPHLAFKAAMPGRVDLWPAIAKADKPADDLPWHAPLDQPSATDPVVELAGAIADEIVRMKLEETIPAERGHSGVYERRPVTEGDVLILVQGRGQKQKVSLFAEIIRACKSRGLRVAGADRLRIGGELAVRDITALLRFLALAEDSLSLAAALRSPLFGWTEQELFTLAQGRGKRHLWQVLRDRAEDHPATMAVLDDLRRWVDYLRPYDLITRLLVRHDGRRRLLARLGPEAEDGIDALLAQALAYEQAAIPGLTGFVEWMQTEEVEIKRQMDGQGDRIRVMTVHGAKGLEAPIVFLPDTGEKTPKVQDALYPARGGVLWAPPKDRMPAAMTATREEILAAQERERRRLLYVAMTRAECWLIACAAGETGTGGDSWHSLIAEGMAHAEAVTHDFPTGPGLRVEGGDWSGLPLCAPEVRAEAEVPAPDLGPVTMPVPVATISPSDLGGTKVLPGEAEEGDAERALALGRLVHLLLEHLPGAPPAGRVALGRALAAGSPDAGLLDDTDRIVADVAALIDRPELAAVFATEALTEVEVTADLPELGGRRLHGVIDRLLIDENRILAVDYKTNRIAPASAAETPEGLLRQIGAYRAMLTRIWPDRAVTVAVLWTATGTLMTLDPADLAAALGRATLP